ncbi:MAG: hypothetical protein PVH85_15120 [Desulfobacterales bacterium]|jgi:hypothetical protein
MYLFFVREFNDIDHITPIVWKMKQDDYPVAVYCLNPKYDLHRDYRLRFLRTQRVKVKYIFDEFGHALGPIHLFMRFIGRTCYAIANRLESFSGTLFATGSAKLQNRAKKFGKKIYKRCREKFYDISWARDVIAQSGARIVCFDHVNPNRYVVDILLTAAGEKAIPAIALPHGVFIYTNTLVRTGSTEEDRYDKFNRFDFILTQNELRKEVLVRAGVQRNKIIVMGSARYCNEWMTQNKKILPRTMKSNSARSGRLKAVFMTTRFAYKIDVERMLKTFDILSKLEGVDMVVKPHTRTGSEAKVYENIPLSNVSEFSSVELSEWADVVLAIGSSIIIEPLKQGKPVLYLKYLHENTTQYEELGACWTIYNEAELKDALLTLLDNKKKVTYSKENVNRFLSEIIYGGPNERDVLGDYEDFIVNHARK